MLESTIRAAQITGPETATAVFVPIERSDGAKTAVSISGTVICAALLVLSSILMVDATTQAFLYWHF